MAPLQLLLVQDVNSQQTGMPDTLTVMLARVDRCDFKVSAGCCLSFCPIGSLVACSVSAKQIELFSFDNVLGQIINRTASISGICKPEEQITSHAWGPGGYLLIGTSAGRLLKAEGKHMLSVSVTAPQIVVLVCCWHTFCMAWLRTIASLNAVLHSRCLCRNNQV